MHERKRLQKEDEGGKRRQAGRRRVRRRSRHGECRGGKRGERMIKRKFKIKRWRKKRITKEEWGRRRGTEMKAKNGKGGGGTRRMKSKRKERLKKSKRFQRRKRIGRKLKRVMSRTGL